MNEQTGNINSLDSSISGHITSKRKENVRQEGIFANIRGYCNNLTGNQMGIDKCDANQELYENNREVVSAQTRERFRERLKIAFLIGLFFGEVIISIEAARNLSDRLSPLTGLPPNHPILLTVGALGIPIVLMVAFLIAKMGKAKLKKDSDDVLQEAQQAYQNNQDDDSYTKDSRKAANLRKAMWLGPIAYIVLVSSFYFNNWSAVKDMEQSENRAETRLFLLEEKLFGKEALPRDMFSEHEKQTPYSSILGGMMLVILTSHAIAALLIDPKFGEKYPMAGFCPKKNLAERDKLQLQNNDMASHVVKTVEDPKNIEIQGRIITLIENPVRHIINLCRGENTFDIAQSVLNPPQPNHRGYLGLLPDSDEVQKNTKKPRGGYYGLDNVDN